jgi:hypothetical protein
MKRFILQHSFAKSVLKRLLATIVCGCLPLVSAWAQGFNWQYSARMPSDVPTLFVGVQGGYGLTQHFAGIPMQERMADGRVCDCQAQFERANGREIRAGIVVEQWLSSGDFALYASAQVQQEQATFRALAAPLRISPWTMVDASARGDFQTEYLFATSTLSASIEAGAKYKFYPSPVFIGFGVNLAYTVRDASSLRERSVNVNFNYEQNELPLDFVRRTALVPSAKAVLGVDLPLAKGLYASPAAFVMVPMSSLASNAAWFRVCYGVQISVVFGVNR